MDSEREKQDEESPDESTTILSLQSDSEDFVELLRIHHQNDFPNPDRDGCPTNEVLLNLAKQAKLNDELSDHLFGCSECFDEYRSVLLQRDKKAIPIRSTWFTGIIDGLRRRPWLAIAGACTIILLLSIAAIGVWRRSQQPIIAKSESHDNQPAIENNGQVSTPESESNQKERSAASQTSVPSPKVMAIALDNYPLFRDSSESLQPEGVISLPRESIILAITLPQNSERCTYDVFFADAFGKRVLTGSGSSKDGKTLKVGMNLSKLTGSQYRLGISCRGEAPNFYKVSMTGK